MRVSVVVPVLNEEGNLRELHRRLVGTFEKLGCDRRLIFVDDGSTDRSAEVIGELAGKDPTVIGLRLSRNFGHEAASTAGLDAAAELESDGAVLMDADLQDPPEVIEELFARWREGYQIVYAVRRQRHGETALKKGWAWLFYRSLNWISDVRIPMDVGDFRLVDAKVLEAVRLCREQDRFVRGLVVWTGFKSTAVAYDRPARFSGVTKYRFWKLLFLSLDAAVGFSITPLRFASAVGFVVTIFSLIMVLIIVIQKVFIGINIQGYALLASGLFFLGGVQMLLLGILGEYIGRIYRQTQGRPLYLVSERISGKTTTEGSETEPPARRALASR
jgi:dolichol-phosphate mannosyltransferase